MQFFKLALVAISVGSAVAAPAPAPVPAPVPALVPAHASIKEARGSNTVVTSLLSVINSVKPILDSEIASINQNIIGGVINNGAVPAVSTLLNNLIGTLNGLSNSLLAIVNNVALPLANGELNNVPLLLSEILGLIGSVGTALTKVILASTPDILSTLNTELNAAANAIQPIANPLIMLINRVLQSSASASPFALLINALLSTLKNVGTSIITPIVNATNS